MTTFHFSCDILFNGRVSRACLCLFVEYFDRFIDPYTIHSYYDTTKITRFNRKMGGACSTYGGEYG